jgi:hypothetical protein
MAVDINIPLTAIKLIVIQLRSNGRLKPGMLVPGTNSQTIAESRSDGMCIARRRSAGVSLR